MRERSLNATAALELLSLVTELSGPDPDDLSPREVAGCVLRRGLTALRAAGGAARVFDCRGETLDVVEAGSPASVPEAVADLVVRGEDAWLSSPREIQARFAAHPNGLDALASVRVELIGRPASGVAFWFDEGRDFPEIERSFLRALAQILVQKVERLSLLAQWRTGARDRERMAHWADVLSDAFRLILSRASLERTLDELARVSCEIPADFSAIRVFSADRQSLDFRALHHRDPAQGEILRATLEGRSMPASLGETARVLQTGEGLLLPAVDMEKVLLAYAGTPFGDYAARFPVSTAMVVPLRSRGGVYGVVTVARIDPDPFEPADLQFLQEVADRAAAALDNTDLLQKVARSEGHLRIALEAGRLGAWDWDMRAARVSWSAMLERIHGIAAGTFPGTFEAYQRDIHADDRERILGAITRAVEERSEYHVVYRIIRPDGETRWLEAHGRLLLDQAGTPQRMVGVCVDITERRTSEEQLRQMVLALRDADQRKDQFLAMLAHELRNPLGPMLNATHLLQMTGLKPELATRAREILNRQVGHMARLLDDLLDVSRITRGKIQLVREAIDIGALTREVVGDHQGPFGAAGLSLNLIAPAGPLFVHADRARMAQVIGNLLSNALKFSQRGQSVHVRVEREAAGERAVLTVRDEGAGIEPALLGKIFEPFVQAETSLSRPRGGLGLGLAVVKGLVELHGGHVVALSGGSRQGAEFRIEMQLLDAVPVQAVASSRAESGDPHDAATVLVFEDNADAAESLRVVLATAGYRVWVEETGGHAIEALKRVRPDVVLCDLGLPERDGYAVAGDIRAYPEWAHLPLIAISGYGSAEDHVRSRRAGFDLHLTKPVPPDLLMAEVSRRGAPG